jgi:AmiR/NasT family two-component response regulator
VASNRDRSAIAGVQRLDRVRRAQHGHLAKALDSRHLIGLAQGILMERFNLDTPRALAILRRYSQDHNVKLREVADQVVTTRGLPDDARWRRGSSA